MNNNSNSDVLTPLIEAAQSGRFEEVKALWAAHQTELQASPVVQALLGDRERLKHSLELDPSLISQKLGPGNLPLLCWVTFSKLIDFPAFEAKLLKTAELLLAVGADPNSFWMGSWAGEDVPETALYGATGVTNHAGMTKLLLDAGADPNEGLGDAYPYRGEAVYHACDHPGRNECLRLLFEAGASQPAKDYCIFRKLDFEDPAGVQLFIDYGCSLNDNRVRTPLSHALLRGRSVQIIQLLLENGADPNLADADGSTPYVIARRYRNHEAAELLVKFGAKTNLEIYDQILIAAADGEIKTVQQLAKDHPEVVKRFSEYGRQANDGLSLGHAGSVLHDLARAGQAQGLTALISIGFNPGALNHFGESPLHWACLAGRAEAAQVLIEAGAPLGPIENNHQADPIGWACWGSLHWQEPHGDYPATVLTMLTAGARIPDSNAGTDAVNAVIRDFVKSQGQSR